MKAHGQYFANKAEADARIAEINEEILRYGVSDGRVTEIQSIISMMILWEWEDSPVTAFLKTCDRFTKDGRFVRPADRGIAVGSRVIGVFDAWGSKIPWTGTVLAIHNNCTVTYKYDEPFVAEGPYVGDFRTYESGGSAPGDLRLADEIWT